MASVQLRNVTKAWGDVVVSKDINLDIHEGVSVLRTLSPPFRGGEHVIWLKAGRGEKRGH